MVVAKAGNGRPGAARQISNLRSLGARAVDRIHGKVDQYIAELAGLHSSLSISATRSEVTHRNPPGLLRRTSATMDTSTLQFCEVLCICNDFPRLSARRWRTRQ